MVEALRSRSRREKTARRQVSGAKGGQKKQKQPSIASNGVPSIATARMVYLWSWGPIVGPVNGLRSIKLDGTPLVAEDGTVNFPGVKWQFRSGELNQPRLEGVTEASNEIQVGHELRSNTPWVYSITNPVIDAVRVRLAWPQLQRQDSNGNVDGVRIEYAIDVATDGGPYQQVLASEVNRKNVTKYERSHRVELPDGARWTIRVRRLTAEANSSTVADGMLVDAIAEVVDSDQEYPLTAVSCIEYDAQQFDGDIAKIAALMRGRIVRVPTNYNPETRAYAKSGAGTSNGVWDGSFKEAYTNNPAWVFYDLVLHPYYGLGDRIDASMINRWSLYRIGQYCDQLVPDGKGGQEPRFTCNLYLQKQADAWAVLQDLAAIFHGLAYWDGSQISVNADMPQDSAFTYTLSQILGDGAIEYTGSRWRDRNSLALVSFDDPDQGYETDKEPVFDEDAIAEYGVRETSIEAVGCTSRGQAQRAGQWALQTEQLQLRGATLRVGLDGYIPKPGKVISLSDPMLAGRANGGRIAAVTGRVVTVDRDIEVPTGARLLVNLPSGKTEARQVRSVAGRKVTVMADYSELPQAECAWALDYDDLKLMQFYVRNVTRPEWHQFQLEVIQHEPSKFDAVDFGTVIDDRPISVLPAGVQEAPARVLISSHSVVDQGIAVTTMTIAWDSAPGAVAYEVEWRWGARDWVKIPRTGELSVDVRGIYAGQYMARVRAISATGVASIPTTSTMTALQGKTTPPPAVAYLVAESLLFAIGLKWGLPKGAADTQRTELWYSEGTDLAKAAKLADLAYPQDKHTLQGLRAGQQFYFWARLVDKSGNVGPWFPSGTTLVAGMASADAGPILEQIKDQITESELGKALTSKIEKIELIDGNGPGSVNERVTTASNAIKADVNKQLIQVNSTIDGVRSNLQGQVTAVEGRMTTARDDLQRQIDGVSSIAGALPYNKAKTYALDQAVLGANGKLYQAKKAVPVNVAPPNTDYWEDVGQSVRTANGTASAVSKLQTDVTTLGDTVTATSGKVDGFQASINTANSNASAAQGAAQAATDLAGGKGKVIVQSAAPAAADRLPQNLWIDTTSGANTPKRWNGSAWVSVSDKVATDAAAAAQSALNQVGSKADASAVNSLKLTVDQQGRDLTSQGTTLSGMQTAIDGKASSQALTQLSNRVKLTEDKDGQQDETLRSQSESLTTLKDTVNKKAEASTVTQLANDVKAQGDNLSAQGLSLTKIEASLPSISGENLLPNSSFEEVVADGSRPRHWALSGGAGRTFVPSPLTSSVNALRVSAIIGPGNYIEVVSQPADGRARVKVTAGVTYTLSVYARGSGAPGFLRMYLQFLDAAGAVLSAPSTSGKPVLGESFTRYTLTGTAPANATQVNVYVCRLFNDSNTTATLWAEIDNVQLQEGLVATAYQPSIVAAADASAEAVTSLGARVEKNEQGLKSSGEQVTRLTNSLTITDGNVDKAQKAAQDAYGLADGKGKVIVQNAAPAAADRLAQNLWIDTTGGANTPKRWSGSAWTAVTDKVALDAAAAAQNALNQLGGKADASALSALGSTVEQQGRDITAAGQSITRIDASIASAGSENLLFNPSFDKVASQTDRAPMGWGWGNSGGTVTRSFVPSSLDPAGQALRFNFAGFSESSNYIDLIPSTDVAISAGQVVTLSAYFKLTAGCYVRLYLQPRNAAGAVIETHTSAAMYGIDQWSRATFEGRVMPAGTVSVIVRLRVLGGATQALQSGYAEWDRTQLEVSPVATGWRDNGLVNAADSAANAAAVVAITGRVEKTEQGLTSTSGSITQLENSIGDIGGENLFYNPAMTKYAGLNGAAEGWQIEGSVNSIDTLTQSWLNSAEKAQRIEVPSGLTTSGASPTGYKSLRPALSGAVIKRPKVAGGEPFTASAYVRATSGLGCRIYLQWLNSSGAVINAPASALFSLSPTSSRIEYSAVAPTDAVECNVYYRVFSISGAVSSGFMELARPQMEHGARATGWRDNGQVVSAEQAATATAVDRLVTTVDQQGKDLTSYSTRTTTLENNLTTASGNVDKAQKAAQDAYSLADAKGKVIVQSSAPSAINQQIQNLWIDTTGGANTPKRWNGSAWMAVTDKVALDAAAAAQSALSQLGGKADAKAVTDLTTRVKDTEDGLSSQAGQLTQLSSSIGSAQPFVAGYSWEMTGSNRGWGANTPSATMTPGPLFSTVSGYTNIQATSNFGKISGTENPYLRIRLRRRNTSRASASMYWANEDGGLAESRRFNWKIDLTTTDWQDIELDLSGHAGWNGKTGIYAIRLDMMNSNDSSSQVDIAYVAVGRRSAAASAQAVSLLETAVTQQGGDLKLTADSVTKLTGDLGKTSGALQDEQKLRIEADSALSDRIITAQAKANDAASAVQSEMQARVNAVSAVAKRVDDTQTSLGNTNAMVNRTSEAVTGLNNVASASEVVRVQITANGIRHIGGFGVGIENKGGVVQSTFAILANRFAILSPSGDSLSSPFAIQGNQTFIADAYIRDASITNAKIANASISNAKIADAAISAAKIGVAEVDTLRIRGNAVTVPISYSVQGQVRGAGRFQWMDIMNISVPMDEAGYVFIMFNCGQYYTSGERASGFTLTINGFQLMGNGGQPATPAPVVSGSIAVGPGVHNIKVTWYGDDASIFLDSRNIFVIGTKR